jgi:glycosyltransferase involved in cell wall biosynthesis
MGSSKLKNKIVHLTSVHPREDVRIFKKQCQSLARDYEVSLVVADGLGDAQLNEVQVIDVGKLKGRLARITKTVKKIYQKALELDAQIYHLHDPELLLIARKLKKAGKKVIFDAHEDFPKQIRSKTYINPMFVSLIAKMAAWYEKRVCQTIDGVIAATPFIKNKYLSLKVKKVQEVNNYPITAEFQGCALRWTDKKKQVCYVGGLSKVRGLSEIIKAIDSINGIELNIAGKFDSAIYEKSLKANFSNKIHHMGFLDRKQVANLYQESMAGLVTLHPTINYIDSLPVKMFEYMAAGLPVIASNFPLWKQIIEDNQCGLCVDPLDVGQIAKAISYLTENPHIAQKMGENGKKAVDRYYNWHSQCEGLMRFYQGLIMTN